MAADKHSKMMMTLATDEVGSGLDLNLNLSLNLNIPPLTLPQDQPAVVSPDQEVVDLTKSLNSGENESENSSNLSRKRTHPDTDGENSKKKLRLSWEQAIVLEQTFKRTTTPNTKQKESLANELGIKVRQVEVWFQNRRARTKLKNSEVEHEYMKQNCVNLMERVRRLQNEVNELRAMKVTPPQICMQIPPATTLTLCPSCERVGIPTTAAAPVNAGVDFTLGRAGSNSRITWASSSQMKHMGF